MFTFLPFPFPLLRSPLSASALFSFPPSVYWSSSPRVWRWVWLGSATAAGSRSVLTADAGSALSVPRSLPRSVPSRRGHPSLGRLRLSVWWTWWNSADLQDWALGFRGCWVLNRRRLNMFTDTCSLKLQSVANSETAVLVCSHLWCPACYDHVTPSSRYWICHLINASKPA